MVCSINRELRKPLLGGPSVAVRCERENIYLRDGVGVPNDLARFHVPPHVRVAETRRTVKAVNAIEENCESDWKREDFPPGILLRAGVLEQSLAEPRSPHHAASIASTSPACRMRRCK